MVKKRRDNMKNNLDPMTSIHRRNRKKPFWQDITMAAKRKGGNIIFGFKWCRIGIKGQ